MSYTPRYAGSRRRPLRFRLGLALALAASVLALTGCFAAQLQATVHADDTVSGTSRFGIRTSLAALGGMSTTQLQQSVAAGGGCGFAGAGVTTQPYDDGTFAGVECTFTGLTLAQFDAAGLGPQLAHEGGDFHLTGTFDLSTALRRGAGLGLGGTPPTSQPGGAPTPVPSGVPTDLTSLLPSDLSSLLPSDLSSLLPSDLSSLLPSDLAGPLPSGLPSDLSGLLPGGVLPSLDESQILETAKISFAFTFPGKVRSAHGTVSGHTVTFTPDKNGDIDFDTTAGARPTSAGGGPGSGTWLALAVAILVIAAIAGWLVRRRRQTTPAGGTPYPPARFGPAYPTQQYPTRPEYPTQQYPTRQYPPAPQYWDRPASDQPTGPPSGPTVQPTHPWAAPPEPYSGPPVTPPNPWAAPPEPYPGPPVEPPNPWAAPPEPPPGQ